MNRSWMFVPGDSEKMLGKAPALDADAVIFDLEDAVTEPRKALAREMVLAHLRDAPRGRGSAWVRINALDTPHALSDLAAVLPGRPEGIVLPKAEHADHATRVSAELSRLEEDNGIEVGATRLALVAFESPLAMLNLASYQSLDTRVCALSWGAEDMAAGIGAADSRGADGAYRLPFLQTRTACLMAAGASGVQAVETAFTNFRNETGLIDACREARLDGFTGMLAIHPAQLPIINDSFTPGAQEIAEAQAVIEAFDQRPEAGSVSLDGRMLDRPHLLRAQRVLALARGRA